MTDERTAQRLRQEFAKCRQTKGLNRYPTMLREEGVAYAVARRKQGARSLHIAEGLGLSVGTLDAWTKQVASTASVTSSQWYAACSSGEGHVYTYGDSHSPGTCNDADAGNVTTVPVASMTGCQSPATYFESVFDLTGNVWEWEDCCHPYVGPSDQCRRRGGSFKTTESEHLRCDYNPLNGDSRGGESDSVGFRCCSDP